MTDPLPGAMIQGVRCYPDPQDKNLFYYLPPVPVPELTPNGRPTLHLIIIGPQGMLQGGVCWSVDDVTLQALRAEIARQNLIQSLPLLRLLPAPVKVQGVTLQISDGTQLQDVQTVGSSNYPPFSALLNFTLDAASTARVASALRGQTGFMAVRYDLQLVIEERIGIVLSGDFPTALADLGPDATLQDCRQQVRTDLQNGMLAVQWSGPGDAQDDAHRRLLDTAVEQAAVGLSNQLGGAGQIPMSTALEITADASMPKTLTLSSTADIGSWFSHGQDQSNIRVI